MTAGLIGKRAYCKRYCPLAPVPRPACLPIVDSASASCSSLRVFTQAPWQFQFSKMKCPSLISRRHLPATRRFSCRHAGYLCPASRGETSAVPLKSSPVGLRRAATLMLDAAAPVGSDRRNAVPVRAGRPAGRSNSRRWRPHKSPLRARAAATRQMMIWSQKACAWEVNHALVN